MYADPQAEEEEEEEGFDMFRCSISRCTAPSHLHSDLTALESLDRAVGRLQFLWHFAWPRLAHKELHSLCERTSLTGTIFFELELKDPEVSSSCPANFDSSSEQLKQSALKSAIRAATDHPCGISVQSSAQKALLLFLGGTDTPSTHVGILAHAVVCKTV